MLPKQKRLNKKQFNEVFKDGKSYHSDFLLTKITKLNNSQLGSKFSFSVPVKIAKKATKRNLLRRRGYAVIKDNLENIKSGFSIIFILKKGSEKLIFDNYKKEIEKILKKSNLLK